MGIMAESMTFSLQSQVAVPLRGLARALRPHQWVKNTLLFSGLIFSQSLFKPDAVAASVLGFVVFCLTASAIYLLNDLRDVNEDRLHVTKRLRPLAAGMIHPLTAGVVMVLLLAEAGLLAMRLPRLFGVVLVAYVILNIAYSLGLKRAVILDVMAIASGFVFRAVAGAAAIGVKPTPWLILCTLMLALLVGFGKRRHELVLLGEDAARHRASLEGYSLLLLDLMMAISGAASVVCYALYTMSDDTLNRFGTRALVLTTPWVLYGVFRYLFLVHRRGQGGDPSRLFVTDVPTLVNVLMWAGVVCFIIYGPTEWQPW